MKTLLIGCLAIAVCRPHAAAGKFKTNYIKQKAAYKQEKREQRVDEYRRTQRRRIDLGTKGIME